MSGLVSYMKSQTLVLFLRDHKCYTYSNFWKIMLLPHLSLNEHFLKVKPTYFYDIMSHHALISKCFEKNPTFAFTYLLKSPKSQNNANHTKERIQYENIHQWCPFWTASAVKDFMFRTKNQECLQASIEGKKSKKEFLFSVYNMDKRKPWMWYFPLKWSSLEMTLSQRLWTHTKKKDTKKKQKKNEELCTHQIRVHAPSSKSTTGHYSTIKIVLLPCQCV